MATTPVKTADDPTGVARRKTKVTPSANHIRAYMIPQDHNREASMTDQPEAEARRSPLERFFGGHPLSVLLKLAFISLLVGFVMSVFGVNVQGVIRGAIEVLRETLRDGAGLFRNLGGYIITGAALVVPIWLVIRLSKAR
jgi:hypothetical protein